jgi:hypothetical protein
MLGRAWFLLLAAMISIIASTTFYKSVTAGTDQIVVNTHTVSSLSLLVALISLALLFAGFAIRSITRPWRDDSVIVR